MVEVHIGFRTSGGRGEFEVVGNHTGYSALELEGWSFHLHWPDGLVRDMALVLEAGDSGKPRLRSQLKPAFQVGRMIAAMLLLPDPRRGYGGAGATLPIASHKSYVVSRIGFSPDTEFSDVTDLVTIHPSFVETTNNEHTDAIGVDARWTRIAAVYQESTTLPPSIGNLVRQHQAYLASGRTVTAELCVIVRSLSTELVGQYGHTAGADPLPTLERMLGVTAPQGPSLPPPDELGEDEPEASIRSAHQYRLAKTRGSSSRLFSAAVRSAYRGRCAFCGGKFGGVPGVPSGIDAAHILAWSNYDLDVVTNGIALCKLHHWAFDAGLMMPVLEDGNYYVVFTTVARSKLTPETLAQLGTHGQPIPDEWLPVDVRARPSGEYLRKLYADLAVEIAPD